MCLNRHLNRRAGAELGGQAGIADEAGQLTLGHFHANRIERLAGVLVGLLSTVIANVGMGIQKQGSPALRQLRDAPRDATVRRHLALWALGSAMTVSGSILLFVALGLGRASVIGTLEGVGLVALAFYASKVLGEPLTRIDVRAIALIVVGTGVAGSAHATSAGGGDAFSATGLA